MPSLKKTRYQMIKFKYTVRNSKKTKLNKKKQKNTCNYTVICMCTRMIFAAVLSPTIKIFHRHLGPNLYIFTTISPTFYDISLPFHCEKTLTKLISCYKSLWHDKSLWYTYLTLFLMIPIHILFRLIYLLILICLLGDSK